MPHFMILISIIAALAMFRLSLIQWKCKNHIEAIVAGIFSLALFILAISACCTLFVI
jgi:hypothetical protein